jgi:hypothetical protein
MRPVDFRQSLKFPFSYPPRGLTPLLFQQRASVVPTGTDGNHSRARVSSVMCVAAKKKLNKNAQKRKCDKTIVIKNCKKVI